MLSQPLLSLHVQHPRHDVILCLKWYSTVVVIHEREAHTEGIRISRQKTLPRGLRDQIAVKQVLLNVSFVVVQCLGLQVDQRYVSCEVRC